MGAFTLTELLACVASRLLEDNRSVFVGTGLPMIAALLAQRTHSARLLIIVGAGVGGPRSPSLPVSVGDARTFHQAVLASSMHDVMSACCAGYIDYGFLGGAAVDGYGNLNTTIFGDWQRPKVRLPGSGGANDIGSFCWRTIYLMRNQSTRTFMQKLPFVTTPGYLDGPGARERAGLVGGGPWRVISHLGLMGFDEESCRMRLISYHPGVTPEVIQQFTGFELLVPDDVIETPRPTAEELRILREEVDPCQLFVF